MSRKNHCLKNVINEMRTTLGLSFYLDSFTINCVEEVINLTFYFDDIGEVMVRYNCTFFVNWQELIDVL